LPLIDTSKVVCVVEIAEMLKVEPSAVSNWRKRHPTFPKPVASLRIGDLWAKEDIVKWHRARLAKREAKLRSDLAVLDRLRANA